MGDPFMQARTMALLEFGCPPLPIANGKRMETEEPAIVNSHDLLSTFMTQAFKQKDTKWNAKRKKEQTDTEEWYYQSLLNCDASVESIYSIMATYTRRYLATFLLHPFTIEDVRVLTPDYISPFLLSEIHDYSKALSVIHNAPATDALKTTSLASHLKEAHRILCFKETRPLPTEAETPPIAPDASPNTDEDGSIRATPQCTSA